MSALHSKQTIAQGIHGIVAFEFADATARAAGTVANPSGYVLSSADVGKAARQLDDGSLWVLSGVGPVAWAQISSGGVLPGANSALVFGAGGIGTTTTARSLPFGYTPNPALVSPVAIRATRNGTLRNLRVRHNAPGVGGNVTYTLYRNNVATSIACTLAASALNASDLVNSIAVLADDLLEIRVTKAAPIGTSPGEITATLELNT